MNAERVTSPREERRALADCPVGLSIELEDAKGGVWGVGGEEEGERGSRSGFLIDEWDAEEAAADRLEKRERRGCL